MTVYTLVVGDIESCCYILAAPDQREAIVIDPGDDGDVILAELARARVAPSLIINTHGHADHIAANAALKEAFPKATLCVHEADALMLVKPVKNLSVFFGASVKSPEPDRLLAHGQRLAVGSLALEVRHIPGHTAGGVALYHAPHESGDGALFSGDTLFAGGIGRFDFPGGDEALLLRGIGEQILSLPDETIIYPGHGPATTVGEEKRSNPFLQSPAK